MHKLTQEKFLHELNTVKTPGEYILLSEYVTKTSPIIVRHTICNHEYTTTPAKLLQVHSCPYCTPAKKVVQKKSSSGYKHRPKIKDVEDLKKVVYDKLGQDYVILSTEYHKQSDKITVKHTACGTIYETTARNLIRGMGCRKCSYKLTGLHQQNTHKIMPVKSAEEVKQDILHAIGPDYTLIGEYKNSETPITIKHEICGTVYHPLLKNIITHHTGCPLCANKSYSKGEKDMLNYISSIYSGKILENARLYGYELDVYLPDIHYGFEYNGLYYHSDAKVPQDYHIKKLETFEQHGIHIMNIFEDDWRDNNAEMKKYIYLAVNNDKLIYTENNKNINISYKDIDISVPYKVNKNYKYITLNRCLYPKLESIFNGYDLYKIIKPSCEYTYNNRRYKKKGNLKKYNKIWNCGKIIYRKKI